MEAAGRVTEALHGIVTLLTHSSSNGEVMVPVDIPRAPALELRAITKKFPGVTALDSVDFTVKAGEVNALLGENGAGKSTLIRIVTGIHQPDSGTMLVDGNPIIFRNPREAQGYGITLVPQEVLFVPELSIGRNMLLGFEHSFTPRNGLTARERAIVADALERVGADFSPHTIASQLSVPQLRLSQLARTLVRQNRVLVLDEPTAVLSEPDAEQFLERLAGLRDSGAAIVYVTHRLSEAMRLANRLTVLRDGRMVGTFKRGELDRHAIAELMTKDEAKRNGSLQMVVGEEPAAAKVLEVRDFSAPGRFEHVSLTVARGQIVGVAGVQGSGHGHLLRAIAGVDPVRSGEILIEGRKLGAGSLGQAFAAGVLLVPSDRRRAAMVPTLSVRSNIVLSRRIRLACRRFGLRWPRREKEMVRGYVDRLAIRPRSLSAVTSTLSGGNQQKVAIARALESEARVMLLEEPTQGIDIHAKGEIRHLLLEAARVQRRSVVVATSEFEELLGFADVIHVMCSGRVVATLAGQTATYRDILINALP